MATAQKVTPPASVQETLRSIAENAARWTDIAGVSLARSSSAENALVTTTPDAPTGAEPTVEAGQSDVASSSHANDDVEIAAVPDVSAPLQDVVEAAPDHHTATQSPVETPRIEAASEAPLEEDTEPVVQWPIEPPVIQAPLVAAHTPATQHEAPVPTPTPFQIFAAQLEASDAHTDVSPLVEDEPTQAHTATPAPIAEVVIDKPLAPWETRIDAVAPVDVEKTDTPALSDVSDALETVDVADDLNSSAAADASAIVAAVEPQSAVSHTSNVVRFPGFAAQAAPATSATIVDESSTERTDPAESAELAEPTEPTIQRTPLRGHTPANGFEFHAPAASMVELPTLDLLARADTDVEPVSEEKLIETGLLIEQRLQEFKVPVTVVGHSAGPVITRFEVEPALGVRGSQIVGLMKDLSRGLGLTSIRVVETIPGKTCMGLELPNAKRQTIRLSEILEASVYQNSHSQLTLAMGKDITGHPVVADLAKAPHMLVAGTTGSGKSVAINAMICSLLYKATPEEVRLIMIDPKMLELSVYEGIPHLLAPVVTDMKLAANALNWCVGEMEKRYRLMSAVGVRNLAGFNQKIRDTEAKGKKLGNPFSLTPDAPEPLAPLPLIVVVIDELADLMMVAGKKIEELIARLAQKARAAGIHLILATQRPSVDVITGLIKANIPTRVAFQVSSKIDSRTILDQMGAESLLGQGDMLFLPPGTGYPQRVHGAFVADEEVHRIVEYLKQFGEPQYEEGILDGPATEGAAPDLFGDTPDAEADPLYDEAVAFVVRTRRASISSVQRQLRIGYNRAARLVEQMETAGLVSAMGINGSREVLAPGPAE